MPTNTLVEAHTEVTRRGVTVRGQPGGLCERSAMQVPFLPVPAPGSDHRFNAIYQNWENQWPKEPDLCSSVQVSTPPNTTVKGIHRGGHNSQTG